MLVSHNLGAVASLCETGILVENGQVLVTVAITQIVTRYLSEVFPNKIGDLERLRYPGYGKVLRFWGVQLLSAEAGNVKF